MTPAQKHENIPAPTPTPSHDPAPNRRDTDVTPTPVPVPTALTLTTAELLARFPDLVPGAWYKGYDVSARADLSQFSDADSVSAEAKDAMAWAAAVGIISGSTDANGNIILDAQGVATRVQIAAIIGLNARKSSVYAAFKDFKICNTFATKLPKMAEICNKSL